MKLTKDQIAALVLPDDIKADIIALFSDIEAKQTEVDSIRAKLPKDSQKIVESVDYDKFVAATEELNALKKEMESKLDKDGGTAGGALLSAFAPFFE